MKRIVLALLISVMAIWTTGAMAAETRVGVVDMQKIFQSSPQVKQINDNLNKQFSSRKDELVKMGKELQTEMQGYQKNKSVLSAGKLDALKEKITKQEMQLRQAQTKFQQELFVAQNQKMSDFVAKVKSIVSEIAAKQDLLIVLPENIVLYNKDGKDITADVISKLK